MTLFQSLANAAGYDPIAGPGSSCTAEGSSGQCVVKWGSGVKAVSSVVLLANGLSFAVWPEHPFRRPSLTVRVKVMTLIFTSIGSAADYGNFGRWLLLAVTVICWAAQFSSMSLTCEVFLSLVNFLVSYSYSSISVASCHDTLHDWLYHLRGNPRILRRDIPSIST